jgi:O-antigen/teichoic acid export membrane protein
VFLLNRLIQKYKTIPVQVKASLWFLVCSFLQKGISCITTPIFTRLLSTTEFGQFNVFTSWQSIVTIVLSLNLWSGGYMQGMVKFEKDRKRYSSSLQGLTLTLVMIGIGVYLLFHDFWNAIFMLSTPQMLCMLILVWTSSAFSFWASEQRVDFKYKQLILLTLFISLAKPILGIFLVLNFHDKVTARIIGLVIVELVFIGCFGSQMRDGKTFFSKKYWKYQLRFNLPLLPHYLSMTILSSSDRIMISRITGEAEAGIYSLAYSISLIMTLFNTALIQTIEPWLYKKIRDNNIEDISKVAYPSFTIIACVNVALISLAPEIVSIFAPAEYQAAIWVIPPVAMGCYFIFAYSFFAVFEFYYEKTKGIAAATMVGAILNMVLNYIFIKKFGYYAAGYNTLLCYILFALFHYIMMRKVCRTYLDNRKGYDEKVLLLISILFMLIGFILLATYSYPVIRYAFVLIMLLVVFVKRYTIRNIVVDMIKIRK